MTQPKFAAICNDNADLRVYGLGETEDAAEADARETHEGLGWSFDGCEVVAITADQAARIGAGEVDAKTLGLLTPGIVARLVAA
jgi:hypothetical protein